jgi:gamma-glutamyltranspeptidase/glutathione hydrolase/leukotriene-C4 hydrolase
LELIAKEGADVLYNGSLTESFVQDIRDNNGIITVEDMRNYRPEWQRSIKIELPFNQVLYTAPLPGSGVILGFIMNILSGFLDYSQPTSITNWQKIIESFKYGYGKRTELGDIDINSLIQNLTSPDYAARIREQISISSTWQDPEHYGAKTVQPEDHGTAHVSVLAPNGDAVSATSTINLYFGAGFMSNSTGIILNDEMDDFSSPNITNSFDMPPSVANFIKAGKRPLSSMSPSIVVDQNGTVQLVVGAAGGTKITTSVAQITIKNLWFDVDIQEAVSDRRLHHQLFPMEVELENPYSDDEEFVEALRKIGHVCTISAPSSGFSAVTAISRKGDVMRTATDKRRSGEGVIVY